MNRKYLIVSLLLGLFLFSACQQKKTNDTTTTEQDPAETAEPIKMDATFECTQLSQDEDTPQHLVSLRLNGGLHALDTIMACQTIEREEFGNLGIPAGAVSACGGWWAGAGDYFYAEIDGNVCTVMQGWVDEQQEDEGYHYQQIRRFVVTPNGK